MISRKVAHNKGRRDGGKSPFRPVDVQAIQEYLARKNQWRDLCLFMIGIDTYLRSCDLGVVVGRKNHILQRECPGRIHSHPKEVPTKEAKGILETRFLSDAGARNHGRKAGTCRAQPGNPFCYCRMDTAER